MIYEGNGIHPGAVLFFVFFTVTSSIGKGRNERRETMNREKTGGRDRRTQRPDTRVRGQTCRNVCVHDKNGNVMIYELVFVKPL